MAHPSIFEGWDSTDASIMGCRVPGRAASKPAIRALCLAPSFVSTRDSYPSHLEKERAGLSFVPLLELKTVRFGVRRRLDVRKGDSS